MQIEELIASGYANRALIESRYADYLVDPWSVEKDWRDLFDRIEQEYPRDGDSPTSRVQRLIDAYRAHGHLAAKVDPLAAFPQEAVSHLTLQALGFETADLERVFPTLGWLPTKNATLKDIITAVEEVYCGPVGIETAHLENFEVEEWIHAQIEPFGIKPQLGLEEKNKLLNQLNRAEFFETFLHTKYVGQKRFSLEGAESFIPMVRAVIEQSVTAGVEQVFMGMAHRGRLNVLSNVLGKSFSEICTEFAEDYKPSSTETTGDVKYHKGYAGKFTMEGGDEINVFLVSNPSHLESVYPVVEGFSKAAEAKGMQILPLMVHGESALCGQGVVYETLQMRKLAGYNTGGTIHIVINNQIGFTTLPKDSRSTHYCTDIAKSFGAPIFHVNAEDPEACLAVVHLAVQLRQKFGCDLFIDLICYRKYGHNEGDEPAFTQPGTYAAIREKRSIREIYRESLVQEGALAKEDADASEKEFKASLQAAWESVQNPPSPLEVDSLASNSNSTVIFTGVAKSLLIDLTEKFCQIPPNFTIHKKLERLIQERKEMVQGKLPFDWGMAETLAYATLLSEGKSVRLTGQDTCRGTFSHRHALWVDQKTDAEYVPLNHLQSHQGRFELFNSLLSEFASMGFEFGYAVGRPEALVLWEAQFGDFCNGAQVVIDQYLATTEMKWGQKCGLVLLLPHGYEGQGPEHSSARMERFLSLCGQENLRVANPSTPAQFFHLLRRQALNPVQKPLVVLTPKGLLRHPECVSDREEFCSGTFLEVIDDLVVSKEVKNLLFCSGRIFYDLIAERRKRGRSDNAIIRIEQLYPFPEKTIRLLLEQYPQVENYIWVQEEPRNMGAWSYIYHPLKGLLGKSKEPQYVGRASSASPATGFHNIHKRELEEIMKTLFEG